MASGWELGVGGFFWGILRGASGGREGLGEKPIMRGLCYRRGRLEGLGACDMKAKQELG